MLLIFISDNYISSGWVDWTYLITGIHNKAKSNLREIIETILRHYIIVYDHDGGLVQILPYSIKYIIIYNESIL